MDDVVMHELGAEAQVPHNPGIVGNVGANGISMARMEQS